MLRARKEQFEEVLQAIAKEMLSDSVLANAPTKDAFDRRADALRAEIAELTEHRERLLADLVETPAVRSVAPPDVVRELGDAKRHLVAERNGVSERRAELERRLQEVRDYSQTVVAELTRIDRVGDAAKSLAPLKVTRCPNCDQHVAQDRAQAEECFVCLQHLPIDEPRALDWPAASRRLAFERHQLSDEGQELAELDQKLDAERHECEARDRVISEQLDRLEVRMRPLQSAYAAVLPASVSLIDTKIGQLTEQLGQVVRMRGTIDLRGRLTDEIDAMQVSVQASIAEADEKAAAVPFEQLSDVLTDGMNEYLAILNAGNADRWPHGKLRVRVGEKAVRITIGGESWRHEVGATSQAMVLLAYHYALLKLSGVKDRNFPGFTMIDFPITLADGASVEDRENYLVEPFVDLASANDRVQLIVCGRAFRNLSRARRIELDRVWTSSKSADHRAAEQDSEVAS